MKYKPMGVRNHYEVLQRLDVCTSDFPGALGAYRCCRLADCPMIRILLTLAKIFAALVAVVILSGALAIAIMLI
jgi:hypothetical protein